MSTLLQDVRYALRMLRKSPGFTSVAVVALALGIGANAAIFSVVNAVLLRPLPFVAPEQLVMVWETHPFARKLGYEHVPISNGKFTEVRRQNDAFEEMAALDMWSPNLTGREQPEQVVGARVSATLFSLLRAQPALGRTFTPEEDRAGAPRVVVLSYALWQRRFGGDPQVVGRPVTLDGEPYTVVGVMPREFTFPQDAGLPSFFSFSARTDLWAPRALDTREELNRSSHHTAALARLRPGATLEQARAEVEAISHRLEEQYPESNKDWGAAVVSLHEQVVGKSRAALLVLLGAVCCVLLVACANVANLLLARATGRQREIALRSALGAGRWRIVRQLLTESVLLAALGGTLGVLLASWGVDLLVALSPGNIPRTGEIGVDARVVAFTCAVSLVTGILFGLAPALQSSRLDLNETLKEGGRAGTGGPLRERVRVLLVVSEVALALVLLVGAGLLFRSFLQMQSASPGFDPEHVLTLDLPLPDARYKEGEQVAAFYRQTLERVRALPGVEAAGAISQLPLSGSEELDGFEIEGRPAPDGGEMLQTADFRVIAPDYFRALSIPLLEGRYFDERDTRAATPAIIIDETMARKYFPGEDPLGKRIHEDGSRTDAGFRTVVGVVASIKHTALDTEPKQAMYVPLAQSPWTDMSLTIRARGDAASLATAVRREVWAVDQEQPVAHVQTMSELYAKAVAPRRFNMLLVGLFAVVALVLAAVGIYGVISYFVTQHTHELGIRMALGAGARDVLRLVVGQGMGLALVGILVGLVASLALTRVMSSLLYGVSATDPATFATVSLFLAAVAFAACYIPARRATKVDPMEALRYE